jgi:NDP-sugar pyrophosphorylase family protein
LLAPTDFFDLNDPAVAGFFDNCDFVWQALSTLQATVARLTSRRQNIQGEVMAGAHIGDQPIFIAKTARIEPGAYIHGPAYIGEGAVVRHGAFVRENVVMLQGAVLGHASEAKNSLMLPGAHAPHFNYVGDSLLGRGVNLGAGTKLSNLTLVSAKDPITGKRPTLKLDIEGDQYDTGLAKLGAILGDNTQTGCNAVLNPGCIVGKDSLIYANLSLRKGYYPQNSIIKLRQKTMVIQRRSGA